MGELRQAVIKLAQEKPELRRHLVPLLRKEAGFLDWVKGKLFKNKETGNEVKFNSLPKDQQEALRSKAPGGGNSGDKPKPKSKMDQDQEQYELERITAKNAPKNVNGLKGRLRDAMGEGPIGYAFGSDRKDKVEQAFKIKDDTKRSLALNEVFAEFKGSKEFKHALNRITQTKSIKKLDETTQKNRDDAKHREKVDENAQREEKSQSDTRKRVDQDTSSGKYRGFKR